MRKNIFPHQTLFRLTLAALLTLASGQAFATEGGGGAYPNGAEGIMAGALPPAGFYYLNYLTHYQADQLNDTNGDEIPVDFDLSATANVSRFVYVTNTKILGGDYLVHLLVPLVHVSADLNTPAMSLSGSESGLGDISFSPFVLAWHGENWHAAAGVDITAPTGSYDASKFVNIGRNYWTVEPIVALTAFSGPWEFSAKVMYDINSENSDTDYTSGDELHADYAVAYHTGPWTVGLSGYAYTQVTDDEGPGVASDGNRGEVIAAGPAVQYNFGKLSAELKYQHEFHAINRAAGDKLWLKLVYAF